MLRRNRPLYRVAVVVITLVTFRVQRSSHQSNRQFGASCVSIWLVIFRQNLSLEEQQKREEKVPLRRKQSFQQPQTSWYCVALRVHPTDWPPIFPYSLNPSLPRVFFTRFPPHRYQQHHLPQRGSDAVVKVFWYPHNSLVSSSDQRHCHLELGWTAGGLGDRCSSKTRELGVMRKDLEWRKR